MGHAAAPASLSPRARPDSKMGAFADFVHGLFVLLTVGTYALPIYEGVKRRSLFWTVLFSVLGVLSFAMHCEETGICSDLPPIWHRRLQVADLGLSWFLLNCMTQVVLELRNETAGRVTAGALAALVVLRDVFDIRRNLLATVLVSGVLMAVDIVQHRRKFSAAWWRRLALIGGMAAIGALLFRALKYLWAWHGIFHVYYVVTCYLLLLAQRHKRSLAAVNRAARAGGAAAAAGGSSSSSGVASGHADGLGFSTPLKRAHGDGSGAVGATAGALPLGGVGSSSGGAAVPRLGGHMTTTTGAQAAGGDATVIV